MEYFPQGLGPLRIEGPVNGVRAARSLPERLLGTLPVELVDGIARRLRVAAEAAGYQVGVVAPVAGEQDLAAVQGEGIRRAQARLRDSRSASVKGRTKIGRFME